MKEVGQKESLVGKRVRKYKKYKVDRQIERERDRERDMIEDSQLKIERDFVRECR